MLERRAGITITADRGAGMDGWGGEMAVEAEPVGFFEELAAWCVEMAGQRLQRVERPQRLHAAV